MNLLPFFRSVVVGFLIAVLGAFGAFLSSKLKVLDSRIMLVSYLYVRAAVFPRSSCCLEVFETFVSPALSLLNMNFSWKSTRSYRRQTQTSIDEEMAADLFSLGSSVPERPLG